MPAEPIPPPGDELAFSLDWLAEAATRTLPLEVCDQGHLVVNANSHWQPVRFTADRRSLICRAAGHDDSREEPH